MGTFTIKLPDVGEGVAEAELVEWHVTVGDPVTEDMTLAAVMTDKATVDIPSPAAGTVTWLGGEVGDTLAVGSPLVRLDVDGPGGTSEPDENSGDSAASEDVTPSKPPISPPEGEMPGRAEGGAEGHKRPEFDARNRGAGTPPSGLPPARASHGSRPSSRPPSRGEITPAAKVSSTSQAARKPGEKPLASPAVRRRAMEAGVDLRRVAGSGPAGRITADDLAAYLEGGAEAPAGRGRHADTTVTEVRIAGLRRRIAEKMETASRRIAHITYVDEIDMEAVEELRAAMNEDRREDRPKLTLLPFLMKAMVIAVREQPAMNALYDDEAGILSQYGGVHIGIAAQTGAGLMVPVARHCEARDVWNCAAEVARLSEAAKTGSAKREELSGSTITITSLGALGGLATTPIVNHPEVAIVGVNKMEVRPVWDGARFIPRRRMNLSSSFDHRVIDGHDAAVFVQRIKALLENPAMIFVEEAA
ncbi:dihydrolipoamide acetyltransferase family protein [Jiella avicenniae]|uniref:Dihydrolipoamide acetyltransferase component of pyruvate dehydrogenase complex n=1 Tax=Jiella avicenniae TaxID=2907202 RepID=A0A9X1TA04_9HYPH|nr:dihydrolipoamide acetyltransferase family protein [Jiella avicenniae]MCE7026758.1 2-oxo acid dehydrogenase subunit E2 [Jiella avicenniae]